MIYPPPHMHTLYRGSYMYESPCLHDSPGLHPAKREVSPVLWEADKAAQRALYGGRGGEGQTDIKPCWPLLI